MTMPRIAPDRDTELARKIAAYRAAGATQDDIDALIDEWDTTPEAPAARQRPGLPSAAPVDATGPRAGGGGLQPISDVARSVAQGATLGLSDEAMARARSLLPGITYDQAYADEQAKLQRAKRGLGGLYNVGELAGAVAVPGIGQAQLAKATIPVAGRITAKEIAKRALVGAGVGGVNAAVAGAATAQPGARTEAALDALPMGAGVGAALVGAPSLWRGLKQYSGFGIDDIAQERASDALRQLAEKQGMTPEDYITGVVRPGASGRRFIDADKYTRELGLDAARTGSDAAESALTDMAVKRQATQNADIAGDVRDALGVPNVSAAKAQNSIKRRVKKIEDQFYPKLWQKYPDPVTTPEALSVWTDLGDELPQRLDMLRKTAKLKAEDVDALMPNGVPTLEALHRVKSAMGRIMSQMQKSQKVGNIADPQAGDDLLNAFGAVQDRLEAAIASAPGAQEYEMIQLIGQKGRSVRDALRKGTTALKDEPYVVSEGLKQAGDGVGGTEAARAYRQGVGSAATRMAEGTNENSKALLNRFAANDAMQQRIETLAPTPDRAATFQRNMADRRAMAAVNAEQASRTTPQREILKGARNRSTAAQFGEATALGRMAQVQDPRPSLGMMFGAQIGRVLQGRRYVSTERAAEMLADLLQRAGDDPELYAEYTQLARALERINAKRLTKTTLQAVVGGYATGRHSAQQQETTIP
ncbi:MAG: hypothetical protein ACYC3L_01115 [Gemmatimonadaceae bacterium]